MNFDKKNNVVEVLVEIGKIDQKFSYLVPVNLIDKIKIGIRCLIPFGNRTLEGFIINIKNDIDSEFKLKEIINLVDENPVLNEELLEIGKYMSKKTLCSLTSAYQTMLPSALKAKKNILIKAKKIIYLRLIKKFIPSNSNEEILLNMLRNDVSLKEAKEISNYMVDKLVKKGFIEKYEKEIYRLDNSGVKEVEERKLTIEQEKVITKVKLDKFQPYLIHGVTGSGKTEVYIQLIKQVINSQKQALVLVPEISLTPQLVDVFRKRFGGEIAILHSRLSNGEKYDEWRKIERCEVSIVIGARSAVFAPLNNLGIIIIDEEHSNTYKQENNPRYHAIDIALYRAKYYNCPIILGSATPSIESFTRAKLGTYELLEMKTRVNNNLPMVKLIDMKEEIKNKNRIFSNLLKNKIIDRFCKGEQIILLLNRRGFTTITTCLDCGFVHKCPKCEIPLTYHLKTNKMHCHYCDYITDKLFVCRICDSKEINDRGMGTEKLEQEVLNTFKGAKTIRMDVDTTRTKSAHQKIINEFERGKYNILIGTQMISKGLDFPKVTLVGVINGDSTLAIPDFRSGERTFQLLNQVAGRSGRGDLIGEVIIQGFNVDHYSLLYAANHDYISFYEKEMNIRKTLKYPPFFNLCVVKIQGDNQIKCEEEADKVVSYLKDNLISEIILGPSSAIIPKINNIYYYQIIIKYKDTRKIYPTLKFISDKYRKNNKVLISIDFSPNRI